MSNIKPERQDVLDLVKAAIYAGEIHSLDFLLMCTDEGITCDELRCRAKELRDNVCVRKKYLSTYADTRVKKGKGNRESIRPRWRKELNAYIERVFSQQEQEYINQTARRRIYKRDKDKENGRVSLRNLQATERRLLMADTLSMFMRAEIPLACEATARCLELEDTRKGVSSPIFYRTTELPISQGEDLQHLKNTRMLGTLYTSGAAYAVLNMGTARRTIRTLGEMRYQYLVNTTLPRSETLNRIIIFGRDTSGESPGCDHIRQAVEYLENVGGVGESQARVNMGSLSGLYREAHYIPETYKGVRQLRLLAQPFLWERLAETLQLEIDKKSVYDAITRDGDKTIICCNLLTGNLHSFYRTLSSPSSCVKRIYMFPWQQSFYETVLDKIGVHNRRHPMYINPKNLDPVYLREAEVEALLGLQPLKSVYRQPIATAKEDNQTTW